MKVLPKRFAKYKLGLHPDKTKMVDLNKSERGSRSFNFAGFTHFMGKTLKGNLVLKRETSSERLTLKLQIIGDWIKLNRHMKLKELIKELNAKMRGHYVYYGMTFNSRGINKYYEQVKRLLHKWINRRGGKPVWVWERFKELVNKTLCSILRSCSSSCASWEPS